MRVQHLNHYTIEVIRLNQVYCLVSVTLLLTVALWAEEASLTSAYVISVRQFGARSMSARFRKTRMFLWKQNIINIITLVLRCDGRPSAPVLRNAEQ